MLLACSTPALGPSAIRHHAMRAHPPPPANRTPPPTTTTGYPHYRRPTAHDPHTNLTNPTPPYSTQPTSPVVKPYPPNPTRITCTQPPTHYLPLNALPPYPPISPPPPGNSIQRKFKGQPGKGGSPVPIYAYLDSSANEAGLLLREHWRDRPTAWAEWYGNLLLLLAVVFAVASLAPAGAASVCASPGPASALLPAAR